LSNREELLRLLDQALILQDISLGEEVQQKLIDYLQLLERWNKTYNLTAVRDPKTMVTRHLIDSLTILPYLEGKRFIDVGTGAGLPGMVIAIAMPETQWVLLDSNQKKTRFLTQAAIELGLANVEVVHSRIENYKDSRGFDMATSRAVTTLVELLRQVEHLCQNLLAMKGQIPDDELKELPEVYSVAIHQVQLANDPAERSIILIKRKNQ
jgi:16S rRNA (guanine527-N7)-methyltransferase